MFNALIIVALIPLALKGVRYRPIGAGRAAGAQPLGLGDGRHWRRLFRLRAPSLPPRHFQQLKVAKVQKKRRRLCAR